MKGENKPDDIPGMNQDVKSNYSINTGLVPKNQELNSEIPENNPLTLSGTCFIDHSSRQFACIHDRCHDHYNCYKNELFEENIDFHSLHFHPEDRLLWCEEAFPDILRFINSLPQNELPDYRFSFNHRYLRKDGSISQFMHEGSLILPNDRDFPLLKLNVFAEIADFKTDETMVLTIFRYSSDLGYQKIFNKVYANARNSLLTQREMEIVRLCHEGYSSKMIADKLNLSFHTVKNHKRNCMEKTLTHTITELIHLCIKNHWL